MKMILYSFNRLQKIEMLLAKW